MFRSRDAGLPCNELTSITMRHEFRKRTIETLAKRVGYRCSNPSCRQPTSGPHSEDSEIGEHRRGGSHHRCLGRRTTATTQAFRRRSVNRSGTGSGSVRVARRSLIATRSNTRFRYSKVGNWRRNARHQASSRAEPSHHPNSPKSLWAPTTLSSQWKTGRCGGIGAIDRVMPSSLSAVGATGTFATRARSA